MRLLLLRVVLILRCLLDLAFAWRIQQLADPSLVDLANAFAPFALADGLAALALAAAAIVTRAPRGIAALAATDGVIRVAAAHALRVGPGIPYFPMTIVLYVGLLVAFGFGFGIAENLEAMRLEHEFGQRPLSIVIGISGVATIVLALVQIALLHVPSALKPLLSAGIGFQALIMLGIAAAARSSQPTPTGSFIK